MRYARLVVPLLVVAAATAAEAAEIRWSNRSEGQFATPGNWEGGVVPGADDTAVFDSAVGRLVVLGPDTATRSLRVRGGRFRFHLGGATGGVPFGATYTLAEPARIEGEGGRLGEPAFEGSGRLVAPAIIVTTMGLVRGVAVLEADVFNDGEIDPGPFPLPPPMFPLGLSPIRLPGTLSVEGDYTQGAAGRLTIHLQRIGLPRRFGVDQDYDVLAVTGTANLAGTLSVVGTLLVNGEFSGPDEPVLGDEFEILTAGAIVGTFDSVELQPLSGGLFFALSQDATSVTLTVVPEPATGLLMLAGLVWASARQRRITSAPHRTHRRT